jgi:predicted lipoprotein with Yx(FWY)xxD motif
MNKVWLAPAGLAAAALIAVGCGSSGSSGSTGGSGSPMSHSSAASGHEVKTAKIGGAMVLTNSKGFALYWFGPDTSTKSVCTGPCVTFWPPLKGPVTSMGIKGTFGTIKRSDGTTQATFNGHPLYTYKGDTAPGKATGNGITLNGGVWHEVTVSGSAAAHPKTTTSSSGGGGYGY